MKTLAMLVVLGFVCTGCEVPMSTSKETTNNYTVSGSGNIIVESDNNQANSNSQNKEESSKNADEDKLDDNGKFVPTTEQYKQIHTPKVSVVK